MDSGRIFNADTHVQIPKSQFWTPNHQKFMKIDSRGTQCQPHPWGSSGDLRVQHPQLDRATAAGIRSLPERRMVSQYIGSRARHLKPSGHNLRGCAHAADPREPPPKPPRPQHRIFLFSGF